MWPVLTCVFKLRNELYQYLTEEGHTGSHTFIDSDLNVHLAYLIDIFDTLNALNRSLQSEDNDIFQVNDSEES